jgi:hypothetical protein
MASAYQLSLERRGVDGLEETEAEGVVNFEERAYGGVGESFLEQFVKGHLVTCVAH